MLDPDAGTSATRTAWATPIRPYRLDQFATPPTGRPSSAHPSPLPASCTVRRAAPRSSTGCPSIAADGHGLLGGNAGCAGEPPESDNVGGSALPSNETFGVTGLDGYGHGASSTCGPPPRTHRWAARRPCACSLVAVPIMGISCVRPPASLGCGPAPPVRRHRGASPPASSCRHRSGQSIGPHGQRVASGGARRTGGTASPSRSASRRPSSVLRRDQHGSNNVVDVYGSELMIQATSQWEPDFCLDRRQPFSFVHVQTGEPAGPQPGGHRAGPRRPSPAEPSRGLRQTGGQRARGVSPASPSPTPSTAPTASPTRRSS